MKQFLTYILLLCSILPAIEIELLSDEEIEALTSRLKSEPVDINNADFEQLYELPFLDRSICERILNNRATEGGFKTIKEVRLFLNLEEDYFKIVRGCIKLAKTEKAVNTLIIDSRMKLEQPVIAEIADSNWLGTAPFYQQKITYSHTQSEKSVYSRFLTRKESGELATGSNFKYNFEYTDKQYQLLMGSFRYNSPTSFGWQNSSFGSSGGLSTTLTREKAVKTSLSSARTDLQGLFTDFSINQNLSLAAFYGESYLQAIKDSNGTVTRINYTHLSRTPAEISDYSPTTYLLGGTEIQYNYARSSLRGNLLYQKFKDQTTADLALPGTFASEISFRQLWSPDFISKASAILTPERKPAFEANNYMRFEQNTVELSYSYCAERSYLLPINTLIASGAEWEQNLSLQLSNRTPSEEIALKGKLGWRKYASEEDQTFLTSNIAVNGQKRVGNFLYNLKAGNSITYQQYTTRITKENNSNYQFKINWRTDSLNLQTILTFNNSNLNNRPYGYIFGQAADYKISNNWQIKFGGDLYFSQAGITLTQTRTDISSAVNTRFFSGEGNDFYTRISCEYKNLQAESGALIYRTREKSQEVYRTLIDMSLHLSL